MTGLREGDRVALLVPGSPRYVDAVMSLLARGIFPVPLDPRLTPYERERIFAGLRPQLVVEDDSSLAALVGPTIIRGTAAGAADALHQRHDGHAQGCRQRTAVGVRCGGPGLRGA